MKNLVNIFLSPGELFEQLKISDSWKAGITPLLLLAGLGVVSMVFLNDLLMDVQFKQAVSRIENAQNLSDDKKDEILLNMEERFSNPTVYTTLLTWISSILSIPIRVVVMTLIVLLTGNFILGGEKSYSVLFSVTTYVYLINILELAIKIPLMLNQWSVDVYTGLGLFGFGEKGSFLSQFLIQIDMFSIWRLILLAIGAGIVYKRNTNAFFIPLFIIWIIQTGFFAFLGTLIN